MEYLYMICIVLVTIGLLLILLTFILEHKHKLNLVRRKSNNYAILIPARNESHVIEGLLKSIKIQNKDMSNVFVIIEDKKDDTYNITKKYNANIYIRKNIGNKKRKGYALDEALKQILSKKKYDLFFIFDADNIIDKCFIKEMLKTYDKGYDIAVGYRNIKNCTNVISACSGLTFSFINSVVNKRCNKRKKPIVISGTGFYISSNLVNKWNGYPFHSLTEDYELSLYVEANNIPTFYNDRAIFYDEQPTSLKVSIKQRIRWIKGFLEARKIRLKDIKNDYGKIIGIIPYLFIILGLVIFYITNIFGSIYYYIIKDNLYETTLKNLFMSLLIAYLVLFIITLYTIIKEHNKVNMSLSLKIQSIIFNPIFLVTYINCFISAITHKEVKWEEIKHTETEILEK